MVLSINHAIYDGISVPLLIREVVSFYDQQETTPFVDLAGILNEIPPSDDPDVKEFWVSKFSGIDTDRQRQRRPTSAKATKAYRTFEGSFSDYDARCNALRITFQALATTAFGFASREILSHGPKDALFGVSAICHLSPQYSNLRIGHTIWTFSSCRRRGNCNVSTRMRRADQGAV